MRRGVGPGEGGAGSGRAETEDAIKDHNGIRDAIAESDKHPVGTDGCWKTVTRVRIANSDHMAEEEREDLADFRRQASLETRHRLAVEFVAFESEHADGITPANKNPRDYANHPS